MSRRHRRGGRRSRRGASVLVGVVTVTAGLAVLFPAVPSGTPELDRPEAPDALTVTRVVPASPPGPADPAEGIVIAPDGPTVGYDRDARFGDWARSGVWCDTRDRALARDLTAQAVRDGCDVYAGTLADPYSGAVVSGPTRSLDVDHIVPLALAWRSGAADWDDGRRRALTNDLSNLRTTTAEQNRSKGDRGPEQWLPAQDRCGYARAFADVLRAYRLTATAERVRALRSVCRG